MIDTQVLKLNILNLATSGQLSAQLDGDDSVEEIIASLPNPSNKRKKLLEQDFEYDPTFEIPVHWKWVKLGEITSYGDTPKKVMVSECDDNMWVLELEDIQAGGKLLRKKRAQERKAIGEKTSFNEGQLLYSKLRPYLKKVLVADEDGISTPEIIASDVYADIIPQYLVYCLTNSYVDRVINKRSYGIKMPRVDAGFMVNLPIPLPPVEEQKRIVDIVGSAFKEIEQLDVLQEGYVNNAAILKNKLIDAGIRGKLTEQLPEDGTAEDLLKQITEEKNQLIKDKKIKAMKPLPPITLDEKSFNIPSNWIFVRLGDVVNEIIVPQRDKPKVFDGDIPWCRIEDAEGIYMKKSLSGQNVSQKTVDEMNLRICPVGTVLSACSGASIGRILITTTELCTNQTFNGLVCNKGLYNRYLFYYMNHMIEKLKTMGTGAAMAYISQDKTAKMVLPLPPYAEQVRIVEKIENLLEIVNND